MRRRAIVVGAVMAMTLAMTVSVGSVTPAAGDPPPFSKASNRPTHEQREAAAARAFQEGALNPLMVDAPDGEAARTMAAAAAAAPGDQPRYFSHANYANTEWPMLGSAPGAALDVGNPLVDRANATDYPVGVGELAPVLVVLPDALPAGFITAFRTWNQATAGSSPFPSAGNVFHAYVLRPTGAANEYTVEFDSGLLTVPALTTPGTSELVEYSVANFAVQAGDRLAFFGQGIPVDVGGGQDVLSYPTTEQPAQGTAITLGGAAFPVYSQNRTYSFGARVIEPDVVTIEGGIRKFVDPLPELSVAQSTDDTYEIGLVQYEAQMHRDLGGPTLLRGYVQLVPEGTPGAVELFNVLRDGTHVSTGYLSLGEPSYLGPAIVATRNVPVRITFRNLLPTGDEGNLFIPTDTTVMGSGMTADGHMMGPEPDPQNPMCSDPGKAMMDAHCYTENRATLHLHGGVTPWISDGTPHQWITPATESTEYPQGVSVRNVPDMNACAPADDGCETFFYSNQQSARLMFYHDHAWGITRLNVYAGEAAPYIITDDTEQALVSSGVLPSAADTIPLVIQDKTFVPSPEQMLATDETWDGARWGDEGDLWVPHVYSPAQNPGDASGVNAFGRWAYGPWFWPPTSNIENGPIPNDYYDPSCDPDLGWCEPPVAPGVPYLSMGMESFNDTPVVNGVAYPTVTLDAKPYRLRILNAANDRFFNLSMYQAVDANGDVCDASNANPAPESTGVACTEVALNPAEVAAALDDPAGVFPTPVVGTEGPDWIQIGSEGGFLPSPAVIPAQPTTWVTDPTVFNAGNVDRHSLLIAPAERADAVVDLTQFAGQTLILYNDAPAAFPARDPRYDYYTGNADLRDVGGAPSTLPGYGPNTRTVMQVVVRDNAGPSGFDLQALQDAFAHHADGSGVFESSQKPIIVGQRGYNEAYGTGFTNAEGLVQIYDTSLTFRNILGDSLTIDLKPKMIQDEMGEAFELEYGRMSGFLGVETPNAQAGLQNMILHPYVYPPTEIIDGVELPPGMEAEPIASADDGTQIWKFTHNGVDTHPIHFHLYDVQLLNRVGWDGIVRRPDPNELGWKDTVRISPLEDTIVALRPIIPEIPAAWGGLPNSIRLMDPSMPEGEYVHHGNTTQREAAGLPIMAFNPDGEPIDVVNHYVNYGWEYVYHCHILSHEEMDMMHAQAVGVVPAAPGPVTVTKTGRGNNTNDVLTWSDNSRNETAFVIERRLVGSTGPWSVLATIQSDRIATGVGDLPSGPFTVGPSIGTRTYTYRVGRTLYEYQVYAINVVGDVWDYSDPALNEIPPGGGFPRLVLDSRGGAPITTIDAPSDAAATAVVRNRRTATVTVTWTDNSAIETGFIIQRADNATFSIGLVNTTVGSNVTTLTQSVPRGATFYYRVLAFTSTAQSAWSNTATVTTP